jgi:hypothetical protein
MAIAESHGLPVGLCIEGASPHEVKLVDYTLVEMVIPEAPQNLVGDNAYDSDKLDVELRQYGIELIAPHRSNRKNKTQDGRRLRRYRRRWKIETIYEMSSLVFIGMALLRRRRVSALVRMTIALVGARLRVWPCDPPIRRQHGVGALAISFHQLSEARSNLIEAGRPSQKLEFLPHLHPGKILSSPPLRWSSGPPAAPSVPSLCFKQNRWPEHCRSLGRCVAFETM